MGAGDADIGMNFAAPLVVALDGGAPIVVLAGVHVGCFELFATDRVRDDQGPEGKDGRRVRPRIRPARVPGQHGDLRGSRSAQGHQLGDPSVDRGQALLAEGKIDAFLGFPPDPQDLRAKKIGHVVVNSATDRPWSQYFCCMVVANRDFVRAASGRHQARPAGDPEGQRVCALDPDRAARAYSSTRASPRPELCAAGVARSCPTAGGASTTPRTRCGSTPCACTRRG